VKETGPSTRVVSGSSEPAVNAQKKLSYLEAREYAGMEQRISEAERVLRTKQAELENPAISSDASRLVAAQAAMEAAQEDLDTLYSRWAELEEKASSFRPR